VTSPFKTTKWSTVLAARDGPSGEARQALAALCETYWYPLYAYVRSQGFSPDQAIDITQGYFVRLLEKDYLKDVKPAAGRFRTFLIVTMKHFLVNELQRERALKRGGGVRAISLDTEEAEERYRREPVDRLTPEEIYERRWALAVLARVLATLGREYSVAGKQHRFDLLKGYLTGEQPRVRYRDVAAELEMTEPAVRAAVRRLRQRFGKLLKEEIAETVRQSEEVDDEVRHLLTVVAPVAQG
jgi:RNA polymerase sigma-70 factor (ECF subfamily)